MGNCNTQQRSIEKTSNIYSSFDLKEIICPLSKKIMSDPVIASDDITYERKYIEAQIKKGKKKSPILAHMPLSSLLRRNVEVYQKIKALKLSFNDVEIQSLNSSQNNTGNLPRIITENRKQYFGPLNLQSSKIQFNGSNIGSKGFQYLLHAGFKSLRILILNQQNIDKIPNEIFQLTRLIQLNLKHNKISEIPHSLSKLEKLEILNLSNNQLYELPQSFGGFPQLKKLYLSNNKIQKFPESIGWLLYLEVLEANQNKIKQLFSNISKLSNLKQLSLNHNRLKNLGKINPNQNSLLQFIRKIENLNISYNPWDQKTKKLLNNPNYRISNKYPPLEKQKRNDEKNYSNSNMVDLRKTPFPSSQKFNSKLIQREQSLNVSDNFLTKSKNQFPQQQIEKNLQIYQKDKRVQSTQPVTISKIHIQISQKNSQDSISDLHLSLRQPHSSYRNQIP